MIVFVVLSAILGIVAILSGRHGWLEVRIILTTVTISVASICALANAALWESRKGKALPVAGLMLSILGAAILIAGIWLQPDDLRFWKLTGSICVLAIATSHVCLLSLAKLSGRFAWARLVAYPVVYSLALLIILNIWTEISEEKLIRWIGVNSILVAAVSIVIPVLHRLSASDSGSGESQQPVEKSELTAAEVLCPKCGAQQFKALGEIVCQYCECKFLVRIMEA